MTIGVLGGGRMGAGIAHAFLMVGADVVVVERDVPQADAARERIAAIVRRGLERAAARPGAVERAVIGADSGATALDAEPDAAAAILARLETSTAIADLGACELVIEAVPEVRSLKMSALRAVEEVLGDDAVLATNTSSISVDALSGALSRPGRFLGLHFFNPVPASALVEVVVGAATDPLVIEHARGWVTGIGKTAVVVRDSPGFASSRLGVALGLEAIRMLEDGVATAEDIDRAMELGYRHPMGPLRTTDVVGLDVRLGIAEELRAALGDRFEPPALLRRLVAEGKLGRKSGEGFYRWDES